MTKTRVDGYEAPGSYKHDLNYNGATTAALSEFVRRSEYCEQNIVYDCNDAKLFARPPSGSFSAADVLCTTFFLEQMYGYCFLFLNPMQAVQRMKTVRTAGGSVAAASHGSTGVAVYLVIESASAASRGTVPVARPLATVILLARFLKIQDFLCSR